MEQDHEHHEDMTPWGNGHMKEEVCEVCNDSLVMDEFMGTLMCEQCYDSHVSSANANTLGELRADIGYDESADSLVKYPNVYVRLVGEDGNAFSIIARVTTALKRAGVDRAGIEAFVAEATSGDYYHLLRVVCETVPVDWDMPRNDNDGVDVRYYCGWCEERHEDCTCCDDDEDDNDEDEEV
jgi:hypothetical protein